MNASITAATGNSGMGTWLCHARGCPEINVFVLFSDVAAVGDRMCLMGERVDFGSICHLEGRDEASPISAYPTSHAHNGVKLSNSGTSPRASLWKCSGTQSSRTKFRGGSKSC